MVMPCSIFVDSTQRKQLEEIFKMMEKNKEQYGMDSFEDLEDQMKLYSFKWTLLIKMLELVQRHLDILFARYWSFLASTLSWWSFEEFQKTIILQHVHLKQFQPKLGYTGTCYWWHEIPTDPHHPLALYITFSLWLMCLLHAAMISHS